MPLYQCQSTNVSLPKTLNPRPSVDPIAEEAFDAFVVHCFLPGNVPSTPLQRTFPMLNPRASSVLESVLVTYALCPKNKPIIRVDKDCN